MSMTYPEAYERSLDAEAFWGEAAGLVDWVRAPSRAYVPGQGWFADGVMNTCHNAVDRHVEAGGGAAPALIYESPVTGRSRTYSFAELKEEVSRTAGMLARLGVAKGDRVVIYMPMIPEAVFAMLACARLGAVHSVVFGGFAAPELAKRIDDAGPRILLTASCGQEGMKVIPYKPLVDQALAQAGHQVEHVVVLQRPQLEASMAAPRDLDWETLRADAPLADCVAVSGSDPLYILYTSGTTGTPKGVVRQNAGHAVALAWSMSNIYGARPGELFWAASDVGWVVGHSYIVYGPLLAGCCTLLFEGKPVGAPDAGIFWRIIAERGVDIFFTAPTALRAVRKEDPDALLMRTSGLGRLRAIFLAGERADPDTIGWAERHTGLPVIDHWWQTELGWPALATCMGLGDLRRKPGAAGFPVPGYSFAVLDDQGGELGYGQTGSVVIKEPLPPGAYASLWNNPAGFRKSFEAFPGYYETGDAGFIDEDGFVHIMGRTDDIINVAGHRLSTGQMEQILSAHPAVAECAVVGVDDALKGMSPLAFVTLKTGYSATPELNGELILAVRNGLGPVAALKQIHVAPALPKTRSGKILRASLRRLGNGEMIEPPATIENPDVLDQIRKLLGH